MKFNGDTEADSGEDIYSESVENNDVADKSSSEDVPKKDDEIEQSVAIEYIIEHQVHTVSEPKKFPKAPKTGSAASLDDTDMVVTAAPHLRPPYTEVAEESYLDDLDTI